MAGNARPIGILGGGPVGSILAAAFARKGQDVIIVESDQTRFEQIKQQGLVVTGKCSMTARPAGLLGSIGELGGHDLDALFICTKTWALKTVLPELAKVVGPNTVVISFQNGIGPEEDVGAVFARDHVARGIVNYAGGVSPKDGVVTMAWFTPPNYLGPLEQNCHSHLERLSDILTGVGLTTEVIPTIETKKKVFFKTILNSALNALCASTGITMRQAMTLDHTRSLARLLIREGLSVGSAIGYYYGEDSQDVCMKYLDAGGEHLPSMWYDLQRGNPTEIDYINGKIVKLGLMFKNVDVDVNIFFTSMIITLEIKSGARQPDDIPKYLKWL